MVCFNIQFIITSLKVWNLGFPRVSKTTPKRWGKHFSPNVAPVWFEDCQPWHVCCSHLILCLHRTLSAESPTSSREVWLWPNVGVAPAPSLSNEWLVRDTVTTSSACWPLWPPDYVQIHARERIILMYMLMGKNGVHEEVVNRKQDGGVGCIQYGEGILEGAVCTCTTWSSEMAYLGSLETASRIYIKTVTCSL